MNYGGIGNVIGHELSHSLDKTSMQFDENIITQKWLDAESIQKIIQRRRCFIDLYNGFRIGDYSVSI